MKIASIAAGLLAAGLLAGCADSGGTALGANPVSGASDDTLTDQVDGAAPDAGDVDDSTGSPMG